MYHYRITDIMLLAIQGKLGGTKNVLLLRVDLPLPGTPELLCGRQMMAGCISSLLAIATSDTKIPSNS